MTGRFLHILALVVPLTLPASLIAASVSWSGSYNPTALLALVTGESSPCVINMGIAWNTDGGGLTANGGNPCINFNAANQSGAQNTVSQICSLFVNNSLCTSPIDIIYPDSGVVQRVPPGASVILPCMTAGLAFFVTCESPVSTDQTRIAVSNVQLQPISFQPTINRRGAASLLINLNNPLGTLYTFPVPPAAGGVSILHGFNLTISGYNVTGSASALSAQILLYNSTTNPVFEWEVTFLTTTAAGPIPINLVLMDNPDLNIDFTPASGWTMQFSGNADIAGIGSLNYTYE
jgi:hypothetical protein